MDYDPSQYRERNNASWDRIRHENAASVRSEPADYMFDYSNYNNNNNVRELGSRHEIAQYPPAQNLDFEPVQSLDGLDFVGEEVAIRGEIEEVEDDESEDESDEEIDRPDIYCMECRSKIEDTNSHDCRLKPKLFECTECRESFNFEKNLKIHKILDHLKATDFVRGTICQFCSKDKTHAPFSRFSAYIGHVKVHLKSDDLECEQCGNEFENELDLDHHIRREHSTDVYELVFCPKCKKVLTLEESSAHSLLHSAQNSVKIRRRKSAPFPEKPPPKKASHTGKKPVREKKNVCPYCNKAFVRPAELARHSFVHLRAKHLQSSSTEIPKWKCAICFKEYAHQAGLSEHKRTVHGNAKQIVCRICGMSFSKRSNHDRHMLKIHPIEQDSRDQCQFQCPDCPTVFKKLGSLTAHKRACHLRTDTLKIPTKPLPIYKRHVCKTCKREFRDAKMLEKHRRFHLLAEHRWRDALLLHGGGGGERKCTYCDKSFVLRASLVWHMQKHFEEEEQQQEHHHQPFCALCDLNFFSQQEYRQHLDEQHSVICAVCNQKFSSRQVYEDHICNRKFATRHHAMMMAQQQTNRVLICRQCKPPQRLTTARQIKEHRARHLPRKSHLCWTCHKSFRTAQLLSLHAEVHDRQPIQCAHCPQVFHSRVALKQHTRISHGGDTNYQCVVHVDRTMAMSAQSFAEYGLAADQNEGDDDEHAHRAHSVTEWMDSGVVEEEVISQEDQGDIRYTIQPILSDAEQPIRCEVCHHLYNNIEMLCDHWQGSDTDTDHSYGIVTCPICESRIRGASEAANHLRSVHLFARPRIHLQFMKPSTNDLIPITSAPSDSLALAIIPSTTPVTTIQQQVKKGHECPQCLKVLTRKNDLDRHMRIHAGARDFKCPTCSMSFRVKSTLTTHMQTHSDAPPQYQCTVCDKSFYEKKTLVVHMRIHTGEMPFKCRFCDLHFRTIAMTRTHEKKCSFGGPHRPILPDPSTRSISSFQPQFVAPQVDMNRTITQISSLPQHSLNLSRNSAFNEVRAMGALVTSGESRIFVITKPITQMQYVVIVQKTKPPEGTMRYAVDTVSEIKINQLQESTNLSIVLHNDMRLNLNTVRMLQMLPALGLDDAYKERVTVGDSDEMMDNELFSIIAHNKTSGVSSFIRRCEICEIDLPTKRASDAHFYSEDHETAQLMYPSKNTTQPMMSVDRNLGMPNMHAINAETSEFNCKLCGTRFLDMDPLLTHIRQEHDEQPVIPPRPVAHTAPIN